MPRLLLPLLFSLGACKGGTVGDKEAPSKDAADTDGTGHTDDGAKDDGAKDDPKDDSDDQTDPFDTDTPQYDTLDTGAPNLSADLRKLHAGVYPLRSYLSFTNLVVTSTRYRSTPPASNAITVQDPRFALNAGVYVNLDDAQTLPSVGDVVDLTGEYIELPVGGVGSGALSTIRVAPANPRSSITVVGTSALPAAVTLTLTQYGLPAIENYESMRIFIDAPLTVQTQPSRYGDVTISDATGAQAVLSPRMFDLATAFTGLGTGDTMTSLRGIVYWEGTTYKIVVSNSSDAVGFVDQ